mgnify:FL=1
MSALQYRMTSGVAVPLDLYTLGSFQGLQRAINAWLTGGYGDPVRVDGQIGSGTLTAACNVIGDLNSGTEGILPPSSVVALAERARIYAAEILRPRDGVPDFSPAPSAAQKSLPPGVAATGPSAAARAFPWIAGAIVGLGAFIFARTRRR